jgi:hypothetical protein
VDAQVVIHHKNAAVEAVHKFRFKIFRAPFRPPIHGDSVHTPVVDPGTSWLYRQKTIRVKLPMSAKCPAFRRPPASPARGSRQGNFLQDAAKFAGHDPVCVEFPGEPGECTHPLLLGLGDAFVRDALRLLVAYPLLKVTRDEIRQFN